MKTLAVKLDDELHAQLTMLAQIEGKPVTTVMHEGIVAHVAQLLTNPELAAKAEGLLAAFEADVAVRRNALTSLVKGDKSWPKKPASDGGDAKAEKPLKSVKA